MFTSPIFTTFVKFAIDYPRDNYLYFNIFTKKPQKVSLIRQASKYIIYCRNMLSKIEENLLLTLKGGSVFSYSIQNCIFIRQYQTTRVLNNFASHSHIADGFGRPQSTHRDRHLKCFSSNLFIIFIIDSSKSSIILSLRAEGFQLASRLTNQHVENPIKGDDILMHGVSLTVVSCVSYSETHHFPVLIAWKLFSYLKNKNLKQLRRDEVFCVTLLVKVYHCCSCLPLFPLKTETFFLQKFISECDLGRYRLSIQSHFKMEKKATLIVNRGKPGAF
ncbi:hypothetical protein EGR_09196 [Echinococcus granulosus]|uniref:Uncharacterized protein n=1 Tax=Echinococcus granulosus TaxID=6210 RepID=W6URG0_ECHGR|nr:hypothetical protein EGR_09196 [Echinococcus granulosus]EUB55949.1 hypothetical protein EGR_09196 [Echinococcus granulosus]